MEWKRKSRCKCRRRSKEINKMHLISKTPEHPCRVHGVAVSGEGASGGEVAASGRLAVGVATSGGEAMLFVGIGETGEDGPGASKNELHK